MSAECTCLIPTTGLVLGGTPPSKSPPLHSTLYTRKNTPKSIFSCSIQNNSLPLQTDNFMTQFNMAKTKSDTLHVQGINVGIYTEDYQNE